MRRFELILGSSVWASALVLVAFMAGLGLGSALAMRWPQVGVTGFAALEISVGGLALALVLKHQSLTAVYLALPEPLATAGLLLLLLLPCLGMGLSLPWLSELALARQTAFRESFGSLYALNTLGAVLGCLLSVPLIRQLGIPLAAGIAVIGNLAAAVLVLSMRGRPERSANRRAIGAGWPWRAALVAATLGAVLLALEMVWLRALLLRLRGVDWHFSMMVATVVGGLCLGAALYARLGFRGAIRLCLVGNVLGLLLFTVLPLPSDEFAAALMLSLAVILLPSVGSGAALTALTIVSRQQQSHSSAHVGVLFASNALGAAVGAGLAVSILMPALGLARAWFVVLALYLFLLPLALPWRGLALAAALLPAVFLAPLLEQDWLTRARAAFPDYELVAHRQGRDASLQLLARRQDGQVQAWRLMSNGFSMSGTELDSQRYMRQFAALPQAFDTEIRRGLLISYGLGTTAAAMLADPGLARLDVVDTSAATLSLARAHLDADPLADPRVQVSIEDGRHLLLRRSARYDLITAEPPPPRLRGVVSLYTEEYFSLVREALAPGGFATHWLPVDQLDLPSTRAILAGFCAVFEDCSLWVGSHYNWMLLGRRPGGVELGWRATWPEPMRELYAEVGWPRPADMLPGFVAEARQLQRWIAATPPLRDDYPGRLSSAQVSAVELETYFGWMDDLSTQARFASSSLARRLPSAALARAEARWWLAPVHHGQVRLGPENTALLAQQLLGIGDRFGLARLAGLTPAALARRDPAGDAWTMGWRALLQGEPARAASAFASSSRPAAGALAVLATCLARGDC